MTFCVISVNFLSMIQQEFHFISEHVGIIFVKNAINLFNQNIDTSLNQ